MPLIFSYGTLQDGTVQVSTFGRLLQGQHDELPGFEPSLAPIENPEIAAASGRTHHANVMFNGRRDSRVSGTVFEITDAELAAADRYERLAAYTRVSATLASGKEAWVYLRHRSMLDDLFRTAVAAVDAGDLDTLDRLLREHPRLACERLDSPGAWLVDKIGKASEGFFRRPYLLWFVAEDPVRNGRLPGNIAALASRIIDAARANCAGDVQEQLDYALCLVAWSWIAHECDVQIALLDVLADAGASLEGGPDNALVNDNVAAAEHLVSRGAPVTLATALCLGRWDDVNRLAGSTTDRGKQMAFVLAALRGKAEALRRMIEIGIDVNAVSPDLYSHATPLHHAVCSGSLDAVRALVESGASLTTRDTAYDGTPLDWAEHYGDKPGYSEIAAYLRERQGR